MANGKMSSLVTEDAVNGFEGLGDPVSDVATGASAAASTSSMLSQLLPTLITTVGSVGTSLLTMQQNKKQAAAAQANADAAQRAAAKQAAAAQAEQQRMDTAQIAQVQGQSAPGTKISPKSKSIAVYAVAGTAVLVGLGFLIWLSKRK